MGQITLKNSPKLRLFDLLRRRKMTLVQFMSEFGITTFDGLKNRCNRMGVDPPTHDEFNSLVTPTIEKIVNNPQEGVVVLEPPTTIVRESTGEKLDEPTVGSLEDANHQSTDSQGPTEDTQKKSRKKKDV
jgi:hypothetical protein